MESTIYSIGENDSEWPALLREVPEKTKPKRLYIRGELPQADSLVIGIVGTRNTTSYGKDAAYEIARALAEAKVVISSGMALGVDTMSHKAAIERHVPTIAVLGSGLSEKVIYPKENIHLSREISNCGALISEYPETQKPERWTFPQRNRIIAGISKAVIVIEAGEKSGALITARYALEYGRDVLALPGSIFSSKSEGTNKLIKEGATPITSVKDIFEILGLRQEKNKENVEISKDENKILFALSEELSLDEIIKKTRLSASSVLTLTSSMEIRGIIKNTGGGVYRKN